MNGEDGPLGRSGGVWRSATIAAGPPTVISARFVAGVAACLVGLVLLVTPTLAQPGSPPGSQPGSTGTQRDGLTTPPAAVIALESTVVDTIARCERAVVAVERYTQRPPGLENGPDAARRNRLGAAVPPDPRQLLLGNRGLPAGLQQFQAMQNPTARAIAAGVVFDPSGLVLTSFRAVNPNEAHVVTDTTGKRYDATIRAADSRSGLAVLAITPPRRRDATNRRGASPEANAFDFASLPIGRAEELRKGQLVIAIGNPQAIRDSGQPTASWGSVTNTAARAPIGEYLDNDLADDEAPIDGDFQRTLHHHGSMIQTDAKLGWGSSGGALVNLRGELVGLTTTAAAIPGHEQAAGYAIPLNAPMRRAVARLREGLEPAYGLLGVQFEPNPAQSRLTGRRGIGVRQAFRGGPAQRSALRSGDLVVAINREPIRTAETLQLTIGSLAPGDDVEVRFERNGKLDATTVKLGKAYVRDQIVTRRPEAWRGLRVDYPTAIPRLVLQEKSRSGHLDPDGCVVVAEVERGSLSWRHGVRPYSFISHVSGTRVTTPGEFYAAVREATEQVRLTFTKPLPAGAAGAAG